MTQKRKRFGRQAMLLWALLMMASWVHAESSACYVWMRAGGDPNHYSNAASACAANNRTSVGSYSTNTYVDVVGLLAAGSEATHDAVYECDSYVTTVASASICTSTPGLCGTHFVTNDPSGVYQQQITSGCGYRLFVAPPRRAEVCSKACVLDPINPAVGNVYKQEEDIALSGGPGSIVFRRFYNSADLTGAGLGPGWRHSYGRSITINTNAANVTPPANAFTSNLYPDPATACTQGFQDIKSNVPEWLSASAAYNNGSCVVSTGAGVVGTVVIYSAGISPATSTPVEYDLVRDDGQILRYTTQNGTINAPPGASLKLAQTVSGYTVTDDDDTLETYDGNGVLQSIKTRGGITQTLSYDSAGLLSAVTDSFGNALTFTRNIQKSVASVTVSGGGTVQYSYDAQLRLSGVTQRDGTSTSFVYGNAALLYALTGEVDENAVQLSSWGYDGLGRATSSQEAGGANAGTLTYNADGSVTFTDALGAVRTFSYSRVGDVNRVTGISGSQCATCEESAATAYDAAGWVVSRTDYNGNVTCYANDSARGLELARVEGLAPGSTCPSDVNGYTPPPGGIQRKISTTWDSTFRLPTQIVEPTRTTGFTYNGTGNLLTKTVTDTSVSPNVSRVWQYTYDSFGHVLTAKEPRTDANSTTTYQYYSCSGGFQCGHIHTVTDAVGNTTTFNTYNVYGQPLTLTDANGVVTTLTYDARQRLLSRQIGSETTGYTYDPAGLLKTITQPDGSSLQLTYDAAHRLTGIRDGAGNSVQYTLDALGNRTSVSTYDPSNVLSTTSSRVFNTLGELYQEIGSAGTAAVTSTYGYDANGNQISIHAPLSRNTVNGFDTLNRLSQITDPNNGATTITYDTDDHPLSVKDPTNLTTIYQYNGFAELLQTVSPATGTSVNTYDSTGNLHTSMDARGLGGTYSYDAQNRLTQIAYGDQTISYIYDIGTYGKGHLTGAADNNHTVTWQYDAQGRVTSKSQTVAGVTKSTGYAYSNGNLVTLTTPSGQAIAYSYNNRQITSISINGTVLLASVFYEPFGPPRAWTWGNGTGEFRLHDTDGNPSQFTALESTAYTLDNAFRIVGMSNAAHTNLSWVDSYDNLDRITAASQTATALSWTYDADGNRLSQGGAPGPSYAASNLTFVYNNRGRMASATAGGSSTTSYIYDALGQRIAKTGAVGATLYWYDEAGHLLGEYDGSGALIEETVWMGDLPVATLRPGSAGGVTVYYVHTDHLGTPRMVTRPSDNYAVWRWDADPFGANLPNENPNSIGTFVYNLRFPGQYYDAETGLNYNYFRDYDPATGRYVEVDPILQPSRDVIDGQWVFAVPYLTKKIRLLLPYAYVADQPIVGSDQRGLFWPLDLIRCLYYSKKYLDAAEDCRRRSGGCTQEQINFMTAFKAPSLSDAVFNCACLNAGPGVCVNMLETCGKTGNGAPKMVE